MYIDCKNIIYTICTKSLRKRTTVEQKCIKSTKIVQTVRNEQKLRKIKFNNPVFGIIVEKSFFWCQIKFSGRFFRIFQRSAMFGIFSATELRTENIWIPGVIIICSFFIFILLSANINAHKRFQINALDQSDGRNSTKWTVKRMKVDD